MVHLRGYVFFRGWFVSLCSPTRARRDARRGVKEKGEVAGGGV
jgi:hypothetical protein